MTTLQTSTCSKCISNCVRAKAAQAENESLAKKKAKKRLSEWFERSGRVWSANHGISARFSGHEILHVILQREPHARIPSRICDRVQLTCNSLSCCSAAGSTDPHSHPLLCVWRTHSEFALPLSHCIARWCRECRT